MGHGKETPRQKMIGMMYLVLTALLALNVSKEILNAFVVVNNGLEKTNDSFKGKNDKLYADFDKQLSINRQKVEPFHKAAIKAQELADTMYNRVEQMKSQLIMLVDGCPKDIADSAVKNLMLVQAKDNYDIPTFYMLGDGSNPSDPNQRAGKLKAQLIEYKESLLGLFKELPISPQKRDEIIEKLGDLGVDTKDPNSNSESPEEKYWETSKFYRNPTVAQITVFSQIQNVIQNAESQVVTELLGAFSAEDFKFDTLAAKVIPRSTFVVQGDEYTADLFVAAFSTTENPKIYIGEGWDSVKHELTGAKDSVPVTFGVGKLKIPASAVGNKKFSALIQVKTPTGDYKNYPIPSIEYTVAKPMAVVSPTKMNVFYIGVENPVDISVSGFSDDKISASISQGSLSKSGTGWVARVNTVGKCNVNVSVKDEAGKARSMGSMEFRVKRVPDPVAKIAGKKDGVIAKNVLTAQMGMIAELENFDFDLKFTIKGFSVSATIKGFEQTKVSPSNILTADQKALIERVEKGQKVYFDDIKASGPDGSVRPLSPIILKLN